MHHARPITVFLAWTLAASLGPCLASPDAAAAAGARQHGRFDARILRDPPATIAIAPERLETIPGLTAAREDWASFRSDYGDEWRAWVDRRSGTPTLVEGSGIAWFAAGESPDIAWLEARAREFVSSHAPLLGIRESELVLDRSASGPLDGDHWILLFNRVVAGIPVEDERFLMHLSQGRLTAFGADKWGVVPAVPAPRLGVDPARQALRHYLGLSEGDQVTELESGSLVLLPVPASPAAGRYAGPVGGGIGFRLARRFVLRVAGEAGTWVAKVDAVGGRVLAFYDREMHVNVRGGVYPVRNDEQCPEGCEQPGFPLPYADVTIDASGQTGGAMGEFECLPSHATAVTTLAGPFVRIVDQCGAIDEDVRCEADLDLDYGGGSDCDKPQGSSAGDTRASRTTFYHLNRVMEKARAWLPDLAWLDEQLEASVNDAGFVCNGLWNGTSIQLGLSGGNCRNTGENPGVVLHEFGHGLDANDGGGSDWPAGTYADAVSMIQNHLSCIGPGFFTTGPPLPWLTCTGARELDWDAYVSHTPATPQNYLVDSCDFNPQSGGVGLGGPCGALDHCEGVILGQALYDLAARDLPAMGLDPATAWQLTEKLFYVTRRASGGNAYNCAYPSSDSCGAGTWFTRFRVVDDDDGDLSNGTPHAAAIFAAFDRHDLACGSASDPSNQNSSGCPVLSAPALTGEALAGTAVLSWPSVPGADRYLVLRNDVSCDYSSNILATVWEPDTGYSDGDLPGDLEVFYRVQAQAANTACESPVSACVAITPDPDAGSVNLDRRTYTCSGTLRVTVRDGNAGSTVTASVFSDTESTPEVLTLAQSSQGSGRYVGTLDLTTAAPATGDGSLSVQHGDVVTARYVDANDGSGGTDLMREVTAHVDCAPPVISAVQSGNTTPSSTVVTWSTDEPSDSTVHSGMLVPPGTSTTRSTETRSHAIELDGLQECTVYHYSVESSDGDNTAVEDNGGQFFQFETLGDFGSGPGSCRTGTVLLEQGAVSCASSLPVRVIDLDLNVDPLAVETAAVEVTSSTETVPEMLTLTETGADTAQFTGSIATAPGPAVPGDGILQVSPGDLLTATYRDQDDGTGAVALVFATGTADCAGPEVSGLSIVELTEESALVSWETSEPASGTVEWGSTAALGNATGDGGFGTSHAVRIYPLTDCARFYFRVVSTDASGNVSVADASGSPFELNAAEVPGLIFKDGFEQSSGWTLQGEWQIGSPQGEGSFPPDPTAAFTGSNVLGHDLTGLGSYPGDYEPVITITATSPAIDASTLDNGKLLFRRWLNVDADAATSAVSSVEATADGETWIQIWASTDDIAETDWSAQSLDISAVADHSAGLRIRFKQDGGSSYVSTRSGWNVDRVIVKDGSLPDFAACGGCGGAPSFAGLVSALDADPCADTGIALSWEEAPAWGTGAGGTYSVYRDTTPGFTPSAANRVATGIGGTSWDDAGAPNDVTFYYLVRAENDETCSTGPNNGGVVDANVVYASGRDETAQPTPGDVGGSLRVEPVNDAHVRLSWDAVPNAAEYHVERADSPAGPFQRIAVVGATFFEDAGELQDPTARYYRVEAADACGNEPSGP